MGEQKMGAIIGLLRTRGVPYGGRMATYALHAALITTVALQPRPFTLIGHCKALDWGLDRPQGPRLGSGWTAVFA